MSFKKMALVTALGLTMAASPVVAQTSFVDRGAAILEESSDQVESSTTTYVIAFFVVVAVGLGIYAATDTNEGRTTP